MSLEEKLNFIRVTEDGIRYKKKRKHHELKQYNIFKESDLNINNAEGETKNEDKKIIAESKGKRLKHLKKQEIGISKNIEQEKKIMDDGFEENLNKNNQSNFYIYSSCIR